MSQAARAQEPSMEEILASIRRIIADDEGAKPTLDARESSSMANGRTAPQPAEQAPSPPPEPEAMSQADIDAMLAGFETSGEERREEFPSGAEPEDVLELTAAMEAASGVAAHPGLRAIGAGMDVVFADADQAGPEDAMVADAPAHELRRSGRETENALLSEQTSAAVASAFGSLAHTVLTQNARTLDDLVREMLRPMLKDWLDDNLPTIVERLVRAEIERVSRGA
ncbi:MAG TPA: DUF2497 domain-containing protein [Xanthobacteraceae bacterium]|nr:DUF2497 domain-containing protein [Xanthobacteraceae bacterium]